MEEYMEKKLHYIEAVVNSDSEDDIMQVSRSNKASKSTATITTALKSKVSRSRPFQRVHPIYI